MRVVVVDREGELERSAFVHACDSEEQPSTRSSGLLSCAFLGRDVPSSGVMVNSKLSKSSGFGKWVFIVDGKSSSVRSAQRLRESVRTSLTYAPDSESRHSVVLYGSVVDNGPGMPASRRGLRRENSTRE